MLDASALAKFVLKERGWREVSKYVLTAVTVDHAVIEVSNAIWKAHRMGLIGERDAEGKFSALMSLVDVNVRLVRGEDILAQAFETAMRTGLTVYDSLYLELARKESLPLVTSDELQGAVARREGIETILV